jgi:hypothetical protein
MKRTVFISHSSADRAIAERLCTYLEQHGAPCWMAPRDVMPGQNYGAAIVDAIDECRVFVLLLSSESNKSRQVVREVERAASTDSVILPFRIEDVQPSRDLAFYVSSAHWLDAAKYQVDEQFDELLAAIRDWQKKDSSDETLETAPPPLPSSAVVPASPPSSPTEPQRGFPWLLTLMAVFVLLIVGGVIFFAVTGGGRVQPTIPPTATASPSPTPVATPLPGLSPTPEPSATAMEPSPTEAPTPEETPSLSPTNTPIRRRPGERLRPETPPETEAVPAPIPPEPIPAASPPTAPPSKPIGMEVAASSQLGKEFRPNLAFDGDSATGWVPKGTGTEQSLFVHFKSPSLVKSVSILNGSGRDEEHYRENNRVKTLRIVLSDGSNQLLTFKDEMRMQRFELAHPVSATWVKFEIVSVFSGSKTKHAEIAEISFNEP